MQQASYRTRAHILAGTYMLVMVLMTAGMIPMYAMIWIGAGITACMLALVLPMILVALTVTGPAEYTMDERGISRSVRPYLLSALFGYSKVSAYTWQQLVSFKNGRDMNRGMQEYEFLTLNFKHGECWKFTDQNDKPAFQLFRDAFLQNVEAFNTSGNVSGAAQSPTITVAPTFLETKQSASSMQPEKPGIERKKDFYDTGSAKLVYWIFALGVSTIIAFLFTHTQYVSGANIFRVVAVLLPGMAYFFYRVYGKK